MTRAGDIAHVAGVRRDGEALVFAGALDRAAVATLWREAQALRSGVASLDLRAVTRVDSAGLALLAELGQAKIAVVGTPAGLLELRAAYRLDERLDYAR